MLLIAHRGARKLAPENTFAAFDLGLAQGCDGVELDVRRTSDGRLLIWHDAKIAGLHIDSSTYDEILTAHLRPRRFIARKRRGAELCCLEDVLAEYGSRSFLDIEIKVPGIEPQVAEMLHALPELPKNLIISSFLPKVLVKLHHLLPEVPLGFIANRKRSMALWKRLPVEYLKPYWRIASRKSIDEYHRAGKKVLVWTVNTAKGMKRCARNGADGILTDNTELLCEMFHGRSLSILGLEDTGAAENPLSFENV